jgi:hypothetical protein
LRQKIIPAIKPNLNIFKGSVELKKIITITAKTLAIVGCSNISNTEQRTLSGAGIGAASGYVYDAYKKDQASEYNSGYNAGKNNQPAKAPS